MNLPKLIVPTFFLELPSTGKKHKYRPYLVKEQKVLLIALEGGNKEELINAINEVINNCVDGIEAEKLPAFDFIYVYLKLYAASNGQEVILNLPHVDREKCSNITEVPIDLNSINCVFHDKHTNKIDLTNDIGVIMKYPTALDLVETIEGIRNNISSSINHVLIKKCIESIYDSENVYNLKDFSEEEIEDWYSTLGKKEIAKLLEFFTLMPEAVIDISFTCPICGTEECLSITQFSDFFFYP